MRKRSTIIFLLLLLSILSLLPTSGSTASNKLSNQPTSGEFTLYPVFLPLVVSDFTWTPGETEPSPTVVLLVDSALQSQIATELSQFKTDLQSDGYTVVEKTNTFTTPPQIRDYLKNLSTQTGVELKGAILIGDIPYAYQWFRTEYANPAIPPDEEEVISYQYYADLDGTFSASAGYVSPGGNTYSYDTHSGDVDWEIWVGVLPHYKGDLTETVNALKRYFAKNHDFRTGSYTLPKAYLEIDEHFTATTIAEHNTHLADMQNGTYSWTPFSNATNARLYFDSPPGGLSVAQGYEDLKAGLADFTVTGVHGNHYTNGDIDVFWVESNPVKTAFFWSDGCSVGNLDYTENFLTEVLYNPNSMVVVAKGTTNDSGGLGTNQDGFFGHNIATALDSGKNFGEAILSHVNVPLQYPWSEDRELHYATPVFLGDPSLTR